MQVKMRSIWKSVLIIGGVALGSEMSFAKCPKLHLNFDLNGTVIWDDPVGGKSIQDGIHAALSKSKEYAVRQWIADQPEMTLDQFLRKQRNFDKKKFIVNWIEEQNLKHKVIPILEQVKSELQGTSESEIALVFPSVVKLLRELHERKVNFHVTLRTFGTDGERVAKALTVALTSILKTPVEFQYAQFTDEAVLELSKDAQVFTGHDHIAQRLHQEPFLVIRDEHAKWGHPKNGDPKEYWRNGKLFYFDTADLGGDVLPLFFDDNANSTHEDSLEDILCPVNRSGEKVHPFALYGKHIFQVSTLQAGTQEDYFLNLILPILQSYPECI